MSFLSKVMILAKKHKDEKRAKPKSEILRSFERDIAGKMLEHSRKKLAHALEQNYDQNSPAFRRILLTFRQKWFDFYQFPLRPEQEKRYLEVLKERTEQREEAAQ